MSYSRRSARSTSLVARCSRSLVASPLLAAGGARDPPRVARALHLPPAPRRPRRRAVRALQAAHDGHAAPSDGLRPARRRGRRPDHAGRRAAAPHLARRAAEPDQRAARRDVAGRPAPDRPGPGRPLHRAPAPPARRVRPGITGWAQVNGRASLPWPERIELDLCLPRARASLRLDLLILAASVRMVFTGHGLYRGETGGWREPPSAGRPPWAWCVADVNGSGWEGAGAPGRTERWIDLSGTSIHRSRWEWPSRAAPSSPHPAAVDVRDSALDRFRISCYCTDQVDRFRKVSHHVLLRHRRRRSAA